MGNDKIYIVNSFTNTFPGKLIQARGKVKFWNRYDGDIYSHVSLSRDDKLNNMMSLARKEINNPFNAGLIKEDIRKGMFEVNKDKSIIAVMELDVSPKQYDEIGKIMQEYWNRKDEISFNFKGLISMLLFVRSFPTKDSFFCSHWVATVLKEAGIDLFGDQKLYNVRPLDFYCRLKEKIIYEGAVTDYPKYDLDKKYTKNYK